MKNENYDTVIIGSGVVGFASAMYAARLGLSVLVIGDEKGGTITRTNSVENYPGFSSIHGSELAQRIEDHARDYDINVLNDRVEKVEHLKEGFKVFTKKGTFSAKTVIFATGSTWRNLNVPGEKEFENRGVSRCALCDGPLFKNKVIGVVGGADSAVKEAILLTDHAKKVYIIYRKEKIRPEFVTMNRAEEKIKQGKLEVINNTNVIEIKGDKMITHVILDKPYKGSKEFKLDGLFIEIGHVPRSELAKQIGVKLNEKGEIVINRNSETNISGVYAAGDVADTSFKQAITGVAEGVQAAFHAYEYINKGSTSSSI